MKQTEIEVEETEVERVYCDECGTDCTEDHKVEPRDVCPSCSGETAVDRVTDLVLEPSDKEPPSLLLVTGFSILWPLVCIIILITASNDETDHDWDDVQAMLPFVFGTIIWMVLGTLITFRYFI